MPFSGGGEALAAILGGQVSAGVSGVGEWLDQIESGELRALAVSGLRRRGWRRHAGGQRRGRAGAAIAPTLQEQGIDVELANWRGLVAPPDISEEGRQCLIALVEQMVACEAWAQTREQYGWQDFAMSGDEFGAFLDSERERVIGHSHRARAGRVATGRVTRNAPLPSTPGEGELCWAERARLRSRTVRSPGARGPGLGMRGVSAL